MPERETTKQRDGGILRQRKLLACGACGWVHYAITAEEKAARDRALERYNLNPSERQVYDSSFRQCLRCESSVAMFRPVAELDLQSAAGHIVTPLLIEDTVPLD
jgi:hypothetical protein